MEGDAEALSFDDNSMDGYTIAFGIRNVTHIEKALAEAYRYINIYTFFVALGLDFSVLFPVSVVLHKSYKTLRSVRVLKRGGRFLCLELSHVDIPVFKDM